MFVCVENSSRSQIAEAFFNKLSKTAEASSAGTRPALSVNPLAIYVMKEIGIDIGNNQPKMMTLEMLDATDKVITMGCMVGDVFPAPIVEIEDWGIEDPAGKGIEKFREIRDKIKRKGELLVKDLDR